MSSISKACIELSKSIKGFRFIRSPTEHKDFVSSSGSGTPLATAAAASGPTPSPVVGTVDHTQLTGNGMGGTNVSAGPPPPIPSQPAAQGDSVTNTINRVIRSATNRVRSFPSNELRNGHHSNASPPVPAHATAVTQPPTPSPTTPSPTTTTLKKLHLAGAPEYGPDYNLLQVSWSVRT